MIAARQAPTITPPATTITTNERRDAAKLFKWTPGTPQG
jgi:hypothetical protein